MICELFADDTLAASSERVVLDALLRWANARQLTVIPEVLLRQIRFPLLLSRPATDSEVGRLLQEQVQLRRQAKAKMVVVDSFKAYGLGMCVGLSGFSTAAAVTLDEGEDTRREGEATWRLVPGPDMSLAAAWIALRINRRSNIVSTVSMHVLRLLCAKRLIPSASCSRDTMSLSPSAPPRALCMVLRHVAIRRRTTCGLLKALVFVSLSVVRLKW